MRKLLAVSDAVSTMLATLVSPSIGESRWGDSISDTAIVVDLLTYAQVQAENNLHNFINDPYANSDTKQKYSIERSTFRLAASHIISVCQSTAYSRSEQGIHNLYKATRAFLTEFAAVQTVMEQRYVGVSIFPAIPEDFTLKLPVIDLSGDIAEIESAIPGFYCLQDYHSIFEWIVQGKNLQEVLTLWNGLSYQLRDNVSMRELYLQLAQGASQAQMRAVVQTWMCKKNIFIFPDGGLV